MKEGFASMQQRPMNDSDFDLLAQAPHSVAHNVKNVSIQEQVWNFFFVQNQVEVTLSL